MADVHEKGIANSPHSQYPGALAEGGILWLGALLWFYFRAFRVLCLGWRAAIELRDRFGKVVCGGGAISFLSMTWSRITLDFLHPSANTMVFRVTTGACLSYSYLLIEAQKRAAAGDAVPAASGALRDGT